VEEPQPALDWLAQREREAAARELEGLMESQWKWEEFELKAGIHARIADLAESDAALFRESAQMWRERDGIPADKWSVECRMRHKDYDLLVSKKPTQGVWYWQAWTEDDLLAQTGYAPTLDAAKAAAIQWVDAQEGK
jgi:hypothetical protein